MREIRERKNRIAELMEERFDTFGVAAFPRQMVSGVLGNQSALNWSANWEMHLEPVRSWLSGFDIWTPQIIEGGWVGIDGPGYPPIRESNVASRYPLPAAMVTALQNR